MPNVKGKIPPGKLTPRSINTEIMRFVGVDTQTKNDAERSVKVVIATENPVERYDKKRNAVIREVLLMDGMELRRGKNHLPIVDSHDRSTVRNVLGSVRNLRVERGEFVGDAVFASDADSQTAYQKLLDGHLTDFSITADAKQVATVERGQSYTTPSGQISDGPADIITRWTPTNASLCAEGADDGATVRRSYTEIPKPEEIKRMSPETVKMLTAKGMPSDLTSPDEMVLWMCGQMSAGATTPTENVETIQPGEVIESSADEKVTSATPITTEETVMPVDTKKQEEETKTAIAHAMKEESIRRKEIASLCTVHHIERAVENEFIDSGATLDIVRGSILESLKPNPIGGSVVTVKQSENYFNAARDGLIMRAISRTTITDPVNGEQRRLNVFNSTNKPAEGAEDFAHIGLFRLAERWLQRQKVNTDRMSPRDIAMVALEHKPTCDRLRIQRDGEAYHTTGSFPNLLGDSTARVMRAAYDEAVYTGTMWARKAASFPDLRAISRIQMGEFTNLAMVPENTDYPEMKLSENVESYKVEKHGGLFTITWEAVVQDDLDALSRIAAMQGVAARRTLNRKIYQVFTANEVMSDGKALFATDHPSGSNLVTSGAAISVATLNAAYTLMALQKAASGVSLNVIPKYLIVPVTAYATALQVVGSISDPAAGGSGAGNANTFNIYGPNGPRPLTVIADPTLDAASTTAWFLAADPSTVDTVEYAYLQGEESPVIESEWDLKKDVWTHKIRQTMGVKAIDWRGLFQNDGVT